MNEWQRNIIWYEKERKLKGHGKHLRMKSQKAEIRKYSIQKILIFNEEANMKEKYEMRNENIENNGVKISIRRNENGM
jgi:hypothetical protein